MSHDDILGDKIAYEQQQAFRHFCYQALGDQLNIINNRHGQFPFPGSHPLAVNSDGLQLLRQRFYYATWKADGSRYMMLITMDGCYLIESTEDDRHLLHLFKRGRKMLLQGHYSVFFTRGRSSSVLRSQLLVQQLIIRIIIIMRMEMYADKDR
ncbi:hypothetical protein WN944_025669 [Citrus x changshan-huyou]|uniref:mRNA capping enzyme adenylation domain-containing protein n=1 Tax=Citrus x changshan-huyou TaxID=2935761 RepID=A0AAP0QD63_9ROSI